MALSAPSWVDNDQLYAARFDRLPLAASLRGYGRLRVADCIVQPQGTPNNTVKLSQGELIIPALQGSRHGFYYVYNDADLSVNVTAAHATNSRRDLAVVDVRDSTFGTTTEDDARFAIVEGDADGLNNDPDPTADGYRNYLTLARIAVAANDNVFGSDNISDLGWCYEEMWPENYYQFIGTRSTAQNIPDDVTTPVTLATEVFDPSGMHSSGSSTVTIQRDGLYRVVASAYLETGANTRIILAIYVNGVIITSAGSDAVSQGGRNPYRTTTALVSVVAGDTIDMRVRQEQGSTRTLDGARLSVKYEGPIPTGRAPAPYV